MRRQKGFTLIELLIVVAIIGIIAAIAIPNLLNAINRGRQKRTMADIRSIATAMEAYSVDFNFFPKVALSGAMGTKLDAYLTPTFIKRLPYNDGWNQALQVINDGRRDELHVLVEGEGWRRRDQHGRRQDRLRRRDRVLQRAVLRVAGRDADQLTASFSLHARGDLASPLLFCSSPPSRRARLG